MATCKLPKVRFPHGCDSATIAYARLGFDEQQTGGGCTAFRLDLPCGLYVLITAKDDAQRPTEAAEPVTVGLYLIDGADPIAEFSAPDSDAVAYRFSNGLWR